MTVDAPGYQEVVLNIKIESNQTITVKVPMAGSPGIITGTVTRPPPSTTTLYLYLNNVLVAQTTTNGSNKFTFSGLAPGNFNIEAMLLCFQQLVL